jgi:hypothetical protein
MSFDRARYEREMRAAQRKAEAEYRREVERVNRENQRRVDAYNRQVDQHNKREIDRVNRENQRRVDDYNRQVDAHNKREVDRVNRENQRRVDAHNRDVDRHNQKAIDDLNRQLRAGVSGPRYTADEQVLADRIQQEVAARDDREWDVFLSYARIDGAQTADALRERLEALGVRVWFDELAIRPGKSQSRQMDEGLQKVRAGIVLLTPAYVAGRFWTERELGALLHKDTLIPVLHGTTFADVAEYSGILPDLAGFDTARDPVDLIADKIAAAVLTDRPAA